MRGKTVIHNILWSFIPIYAGQFIGFLISFAGYSLFPLFVRTDLGRYAACALSVVIACVVAAFLLCRMRGEAHEQRADYRPIYDFIAYVAAEAIYISVMLISGGRTFSTVNAIYACMAILGEKSTTNETIRTEHAGLLALVITGMNVVTLPFALLGFVSGKKKRMKEREAMRRR